MPNKYVQMCLDPYRLALHSFILILGSGVSILDGRNFGKNNVSAQAFVST